jgi:hypothetical protein
MLSALLAVPIPGAPNGGQFRIEVVLPANKNTSGTTWPEVL